MKFINGNLYKVLGSMQCRIKNKDTTLYEFDRFIVCIIIEQNLYFYHHELGIVDVTHRPIYNLSNELSDA